MAFWRSHKAVPDTPPAAPPPAIGDRVVLMVADCAAGLIRDYGRTAIDIEKVAAETIRQWCENWAEHLLVGSARPGDVSQNAPLEQRDWAGARRFFSERRREEIAFITHTLSALQEAVWAFIQTLDGLFVQDDEVDMKLHGELERLKTLAQSASAAEILRKEVLSSVTEIGRMAQARHQELRTRVEGLSSQVRTLCNELEVARQEGATDGLTKLFNRQAFDDRLDQAVSMSRLFGQYSSMILLGIDNYRAVSDRFGHLAGETVLREVADCLVRTFRVKTEFVARYDSERFAVLLWDTPLKPAITGAERVLASLRHSRVMHEGEPIEITVSLGVSQQFSGEDSDSWIARTDLALCTAQKKGHHQMEVADGDAGTSLARLR